MYNENFEEDNMHKTFLRLIKRIVILFIITFLPIGLYLYINEEVQTTLKSNIDSDKCKYMINAEFNPIKKTIDIFEKVTFVNSTNKIMDRIYFHFDDYEFGIYDISINNNKVEYKVIGNGTILMVISNTMIKPREAIDVNIAYLIEIDKISKREDKVKTINYDLDIWYPVIIYHDNNGWNFNNIIDNKPQILECSHDIRIFIPKDYSLDMKDIMNGSLKAKETQGFYHIQEVNMRYLPITITNYHNKE